jgi:uncharacterized phiE125 gp8 family phage protein
MDVAKGHLRVETGEDDAIVAAYVETATAELDGPEGQLGRALVTQKWALDLDAFPNWRDHGFCPPGHRGWHTRPIEVPLPPLVSVDAFTYVDEAGATQTVDPASYIVHLGEGLIELAFGCWWPCTAIRHRAVTVEFTAGYGDADLENGAPDVPAPIRTAILLLTEDLYDNPDRTAAEAVAGNPTVTRLVRQYRFLRS